MNRPKITTQDVAPTINHDIDLSSNIATDDIERPDLAIATETSMTDPVTRKYVRDLAFMEEIVEFVVAKTHDKNEPNPIIAGVNGIPKVIERGVRYKLPRKFLNALINTVTDTNTHEYLDQDGLKQTRIETITSPSLQIQLISDPSGQSGMQWFAQAQHGAY
jgi:hypothetical protein